MKKLLFPIAFALTAFFILYSCSAEEEDTTPPPTVQQPTPEPEPEPPAPTQYTLTVTAGEGGSVTTGGTYDDGTSVSVTATANEGYEFIGWEGSDETTNNISIILSADTSLNALFGALVQYTLTVETGDLGRVSVEGGKTYDESPDLTALNSDDYIVEDPKILIGKYARKPIENDYHEVEIYYEKEQLKWRNKADVSWSLELRDGKLWAGSDCIYGEQVLGVFIENTQNVLALAFINDNYERVGDTSISNSPAGSEITVTVTANEGYEFIGWEGRDETTAELNITLNSDVSLTALFQQIQSITSLSANEYLRDGSSKKTNRLFNNLDLEVLYSDNFAIWWDKSTGIDHYDDAVDILKWSEISYSKSEPYASQYRPSISEEFYMNIYIHHPTYNTGPVDGFPDWGQWVGGEDYEGVNGPYAAYPYDENIIEIKEGGPRMNVVHESFHIVQFDRPARITDGSWWTEATANLFERDILKINPDYYHGMGGTPSLIMVPHFSPWFAPNAPNAPGQWDLWSSGNHKYQTCYFLRYISQNSDLSVDDILSLQFIESGTLNSSNGYYYWEPFEKLINLLGRDKFESLFIDFVKSVADLTFLSPHELDGYLRSLDFILTKPIQDNRIAIDVQSNGTYTPQYLNQALSWTVIKVNGQDFNYEIIPDAVGSEGTVSDFSSFIKVKDSISYIYVVNTSDKTSGDETFNYSVTISGL